MIRKGVERIRLEVVRFWRARLASGGLGFPLGRCTIWRRRGAARPVFFHFACARWIGADAPLAFLNLGGVGNITWIDPGKTRPEDTGALLAFDTGPANAPINDLVRERLDLDCDRDGALARKGRVEDGALELFLDDPYFFRIPPKSLDRDAFADMIGLVRELSDADASATLTAMSAAAVVRAMEHCPTPPQTLLVTGGGRKNPVLMRMLAVGLDCEVMPVEDVGLDGDMLEAQAFGFLAVRVARGMATSCLQRRAFVPPSAEARLAIQQAIRFNGDSR